MGVSQILAAVLFLLCLVGGSSALGENCTDKLQFERVFSVPGDVAMLNSTLVSPGVFNFRVVPYNVTWYHLLSGRQLGNETGRILVRGETLWFLNVTLEDAGIYTCIVRTTSKCYRQEEKLVVDKPDPGKCGRPRTATQTLISHVKNNILSCPLKNIIEKLESYSLDYSLKWYKNCTSIEDGVQGKYPYRDVPLPLKLGVKPLDNDAYTCTLTFNLTGFTVSISETILASVKEEYELAPEIHEPSSSSDVIKAEWGSSFTKRCRVFVECVGRIYVDVEWFTSEDKDADTVVSENPSDHIYMESQSSTREEIPRKGVWLERLLKFSHLTEQDFYKNYTCRAFSDRGGDHRSQFTLLPADPNILLPIGLVLGGVTVLFISSVVFYYIFKIDTVLWFRRAFPVFYKNTASDGKRYDAYIAYPRCFGTGAGGEVEMFALHTLPQVLERTCGYKLFIAGRDSLPGQAIVDSVEENIQASRCLLLLYTASTFNSCNNSDNNNQCNSSDDKCNTADSKSPTCQSTDSYKSNKQCNSSDLKCNTNDSSSHKGHSNSGSDHSSYHNINISDNCTSSDSCNDGDIPGPGQQFEHDIAMYRALMEGSLKVVLVEMEEVSPAQLALFPESVRHLRKKQGAVCWWKNQKTSRLSQGWGARLQGIMGGDEEKGGQEASSLTLSPSSRFWKTIRYHMPARGERAGHPENMLLLAL